MTDTSSPATRTTQLRRYLLVPGTEPDFLVWWSEKIAPGRERAGFSVDYASFEPESSRFVWAVSAPGSLDDFLVLEQAWMDSDARAEAFAGVPQRVASMDNAIVQRVAFPHVSGSAE